MAKEKITFSSLEGNSRKKPGPKPKVVVEENKKEQVRSEGERILTELLDALKNLFELYKALDNRISVIESKNKILTKDLGETMRAVCGLIDEVETLNNRGIQANDEEEQTLEDIKNYLKNLK